ncbi:MAG: DEAD/DEAH box helicase family protein, partial [Cytophagales bacterium]
MLLLKACGWGVVEGSKVLREYNITVGKIQTGGGRGKREIADYVLVYKGIKLAVVEAKSDELEVGEGVMQAKKYAEKLKLETTYSTNGKAIYQICMKSGEEGLVTNFLSPDELWNKTFPSTDSGNGSDTERSRSTEVWREKFANVPFEDKSGSWQLRYYQEIAVQRTVEAIAQSKERILLTLATGTGKTAIAFQIAWKLFQTRWNLSSRASDTNGNKLVREHVERRPRILFLADRNILADQAYNSFSAFPEDALVRIKPKDVTKNGRVPTNGSIFFTIFQSFMSGKDKEGNPIPNYGQYPPDYFDFIIIDECHRGGANDESNWRSILEYFSPAV